VRWRWPDPEDVGEEAERQALRARMSAFWAAFAQDAAWLGGGRRPAEEVAAWMAQHLGLVSPDLQWEFGPGAAGGDRLALSVEQQKAAQPMLDAMLSLAPRLAGWELHGRRPPTPPAWARRFAEGRLGRPLRAEAGTIAPGPGGRLLLRIRHPAAGGEAGWEESALFVMAAIGEEAFDRWVGPVEVVSKLPVGGLRGALGLGTPGIGIEAFPAAIQAEIARREAARPMTPLAASDLESGWKLVKRELPATEATEFAGQDDWFTLLSARPEIHLDARRPGFSSARWSRHGERFAYLKMDGIAGLGASRLRDRAEVEEEVDRILRQAGAGAVLGGGMGLRYAYVEVVLTDVPTGAAALRQALRQASVPARTWLLFHDDELAEEWFAMGETREAPPRP